MLLLLRHVPGAQQSVSRPLIRRMASPLELPVSGGFRMLVDTREPMGRVLATAGIWEPHVTAVFRGLLFPGDVCIDVGAYSGYYTLLAAKLVGPAGHVYALEPAPAAHAALESNITLNGLANVTALRVAAGEADHQARFDDRSEGQAIRSSVRTSAELAPSVPVRTLASLVRASDVERIRLVKIDVEGYEVEVLRGLRPLFDSGARPALLVELHAGVVAPVVALLAELGTLYGLHTHNVTGEGFADPWTGSPVELARLLEPEHERHVLLAP